MLKGKLVRTGEPDEEAKFEIADAGNLAWMPGEVAGTNYEATLPAGLKGGYTLSIQLFDERSGRPVEIGLDSGSRDADGYYRLGEIVL